MGRAEDEAGGHWWTTGGRPPTAEEQQGQLPAQVTRAFTILTWARGFGIWGWQVGDVCHRVDGCAGQAGCVCFPAWFCFHVLCGAFEREGHVDTC